MATATTREETVSSV